MAGCRHWISDRHNSKQSKQKNKAIIAPKGKGKQNILIEGVLQMLPVALSPQPCWEHLQGTTIYPLPRKGV